MAANWPTRNPVNGMRLRDRTNLNGVYEEEHSSDDDFERNPTPKKTRSHRAPQPRKHLTTLMFRREAHTSIQELAPQRRSSRKRKPSLRVDESYVSTAKIQQPDTDDEEDMVGLSGNGEGEEDDEDDDMEQEEELENEGERGPVEAALGRDALGADANGTGPVEGELDLGGTKMEAGDDAPANGHEENGHLEGGQEGLQPPRRSLRTQRGEMDTEEQQEEAGFSGRESGEGEEGDEGELGEGAEEEDGSDGQEGRRERRYALRQRTEVQRFSPRRKEQPARLSPQVANGRGRKRGREGRQRPNSRSGKRRHTLRADDSDNSLLLDEVERGWGRGPDGPYVPPGEKSAAPTFVPPVSGWVNGDVGEEDGAQPVTAGGALAKAGADVQPVAVDLSVDFDQVGGLANYVDALKEMVFFPLLYPDFFANYRITPPRGVLLCGPPGTGKTLVARALAAAASKAGQKVTFYMRKGADVLSKWVGEAERQLKMLFEEAQRNQPSIIFFDEIDGLAPVRSSKQEQIHNSIVSTLLALMDGLDSRGQVVVIGATNRVDAIDSALRRPGRFDREFTFPLPNSDARGEILNIHTRNWAKPPTKPLVDELAATCVGYCGADLKALCTEAAIRAFRHKYPQVYQSDEQYVIDIDSVVVERQHFVEAMTAITPAAHRSAVVHARPLPPLVRPILDSHLAALLEATKDVFPAFGADPKEDDSQAWDVEVDENNEADLGRLFSSVPGSSVAFVQRPRLLLCGRKGAGQDHLGPALLHELEQFPVHPLGLPSLLSDPGAKTPEEALVHIFGEARRTTPAVLYLPHLPLWWSTADDSLRATLVMLLADLPPALPVLLLGTSDVAEADLDPEARAIFGRHVHSIGASTPPERAAFFTPVLRAAAAVPRLTPRNKQPVPQPELPKAPRQPREPTEAEVAAKAADEEQALRRLRMCFRDVCNRLLLEKKFADFHYPIAEDEYPGYKEVNPRSMDVVTLLRGVDGGEYPAKALFLADVDLIAENAKAYFGENPQEARYISRAFALKDVVYSMLSQLDPTLVKQCDEIAARGGPVPAPPSKLVIAAQSRFAPPQVARTSARLRGVQPNVDIHMPPEVRRPKRGGEGFKGDKVVGANGEVAEVGTDSQGVGDAEDGATEQRGGFETQPVEQPVEAMEVERGNLVAPLSESGVQKGADDGAERKEKTPEPASVAPDEEPGPSEGVRPVVEASVDEKPPEATPEMKAEYARRMEEIKLLLVRKTALLTVDRLEGVNLCLCRLVHLHRRAIDRTPLLDALSVFVGDDSHFVDGED